MSGQHDFPALFTVEGSSRHEVNPGHDVDQLRASMEKLASSSPNCQEFMSKHRSKDIVEKVGEIKVKWASEGRDKQLFPKETLLTDDNCEAILRMMAIGGGKDVFDIKLDKSQASAEGEKKK
ncbi:hypothetical protein LTR91_017949 [Friedmanniomyces endolithicus]|uniref:Uncharacterized protein n=1 Tax=Friedmanniomyces endolithicus TaxID=329885 RepID=A0AAN6HDI9_9PEZI|nr:hypothetical protein LTR38_012535 [Friedmanniomyces endolithicus]KAK0837833.1 hypothetical protein LTR03_012501 [Friedmanniomyces endolithicus]KAK0888349.1 hypothetical protein LTR02_016395 [Friedmanniomyces endolithicus]KAK0965590.1 hypothetical protein LTR91_017949 [Friedmanniomyces endolithicus]